MAERLPLTTAASPPRCEPWRSLTGPLGARTFDDAFGPPRATPSPPGAGRRIEVWFGAGFGYAQLYAPPDQDLIAYEPMTAPTNARSREAPS